MRNKSTMLLLVSCSLLTLLYLSTSVNAATAQWFPATGTDIEYKLSAQCTFTNQTVAQCDTFDLYKAGSYYYIMPAALKFYGRIVSWTSLENDTTLTLHHKYFDNTTTTLRREATLFGRSTNYSSVNFILIMAWNGTYYSPCTDQLQLSNHVVLPTNDYAASDGGDFVDYMQNYLGVGQSAYDGFSVVGISGGTTFHLYNSSRYYAFYETNSEGRVISRTFWVDAEGILSNTNIQSTIFVFVANLGGIPAYPVALLVAGVGIATIYLIWSKKKQHKFDM